MKLEFDETATKHLLQRIWDATERTPTYWDAHYNNLEDDDEIAAFLADPENAKEGLPCLLLHGTPFGIFLSGNCALREHEEIFAHSANPNTHPDPARLAAEVAAFFEGEKNPIALHLQEPPWFQNGIVFERDDDGISASFVTDQDALHAAVSQPPSSEWENDSDDEGEGEEWKRDG